MEPSMTLKPHHGSKRSRSCQRPTTKPDPVTLAERFREVRRFTVALCAPLAVEDYVVQSMPDASPVKWHLAHTSWFFETFLLSRVLPEYRPFSPSYGYLFNSYYNAVGARIARPARGLLSRPTVDEVYSYRKHVDGHVSQLLDWASAHQLEQLAPTLVIGLNHEQQHQELILTDLKHLFSCNPLRPAYREQNEPVLESSVPQRWLSFPAGLRWIGHAGTDFAFDNETPRHRAFAGAFQFAGRLTTCGEYLAFMEAGGYDRPELWLSDGWTVRCREGWQAPLYWEKRGNGWHTLSLAGMQPVNEHEPVCHVSYYEADAFARWSGARLPTEVEWEVAAKNLPLKGNFLEGSRLHPAGLADRQESPGPVQMFGEVWQWTGSPYLAYPGYQPPAGALGEYNGKFMCNQMVLRGGSCVTPQSHIRRTYRNFFPPEARWQFSGIRLARDGKGTH
jgi:ergothioneine biosynthesis protein EgtB